MQSLMVVDGTQGDEEMSFRGAKRLAESRQVTNHDAESDGGGRNTG